MPKGPALPRGRGPYATQACAICRAKKSKCDGVKPVCGSCAASGRDDECSWGRDTAPRKPRTEAHFEALRKRADSLQAYVDRLEAILGKCVCQDVSCHLQFRPQQLGERSGKDGGDSDTDVLDSDEEITQELTVPTQCLKLDDRLGGLLLHGVTAPFRFGNRPPNEVARIPKVVENPDTYVLQVDGVDISQSHPDIDWSRHLPPEVPMDRKQHDKILDLSFKFFTMFAFRVIPCFFLRDMYRALRVPRSEPPPRTVYYSPMLHNAVLCMSAVFSDDPYLRDPKTRHYFVSAAKSHLEAECKKPDISLVHSLAFMGTYFADLGERIQAELFFGMSSRLSMTLGLGIDSTAWVKAGLINQDEMHGRNWAHWTLFSLDVCWAFYFGRDFVGPPLLRRNIPLPYVDTEHDQLPWHHPSSNISPQPNFLTLIFFEFCKLFLIARQIVDVVNGLAGSARLDTIQVEEQVTKIDLELNNWKSQLPPQLDITLANRAKSTPQRLMLHLTYWWCFITLHRPFFNRRAQPIQHSDREVDHVKVNSHFTNKPKP
ncbi:fungal-specific transcription factor domain-containing protein [Mycena capillaripes]|nr:fungal-specific transcription factor domain-containing protein [Mycena capillaripes]